MIKALPPSVSFVIQSSLEFATRSLCSLENIYYITTNFYSD